MSITWEDLTPVNFKPQENNICPLCAKPLQVASIDWHKQEVMYFCPPCSFKQFPENKRILGYD